MNKPLRSIVTSVTAEIPATDTERRPTMKTTIIVTVIAGLTVLGTMEAGACPSCQTSPQTHGSYNPHPGPGGTSELSMQIMFRTKLSRHGRWHTLPGLGLIWQPAVARGCASWRPYHNGGSWHLSGGVWYWSSAYAWGEIAYHYGQWIDSRQFGWVWVPGTIWNVACPQQYGYYPPVIHRHPPRTPRYHYRSHNYHRPAPSVQPASVQPARAPARAPARPPAPGSRSQRLRNMLNRNIG